MIRILYLTCFCLLVSSWGYAQYTLNGNASQQTCNCYILTQNQFNQSGSVWNNNRINLNNPFNFSFNVNLGCTDADGADGIAFVLQPISTSIGSMGGGLGFSGVTPSVGVTIDTWQNTDDNDPVGDHLSIQLNGSLQHAAPENIAGPVQVLPGVDNIEDCAWHVITINWNPTINRLEVLFDGQPRLAVTRNLIADVFGGNPLVFWGFTGSTGGARNLQQFCTALNPNFRLAAGQTRCVGQPIQFIDSSISFTAIQKRYWDFGDGSPIDSISVNPTHTYAAAGDYSVKLRVLGADGCSVETVTPVRIGSFPRAGFRIESACNGQPIRFIDTSSVSVGTINEWAWTLPGGATSSVQSPVGNYNLPQGGLLQASLTVRTVEGCASALVSGSGFVYATPTGTVPAVSACAPTASLLQPQVGFPTPGASWNGVIQAFQWQVPGLVGLAGATPSLSNALPGAYSGTLVATSSFGCASLPIPVNVTLLPKPIAGFRNEPVCLNQPIQYLDTSSVVGSTISNWWWSLGNGTTSTIRNPIAQYSLSGPTPVRLVVSSANGCRSDTLTKIFTLQPKPQANFGYATPLCANTDARLLDSSLVLGAAAHAVRWIFPDGSTSSVRNPSIRLGAGSFDLAQVAFNIEGCVSDTFRRRLVIPALSGIAVSAADGCADSLMLFSAQAVSGAPIAQWQWWLPGGLAASRADTSIRVSQEGDYTVRLTGIDIRGCTTDTIAQLVRVFRTRANAGNDTLVVAQVPFRLQGSGGVNYEWQPATLLNDPTSATPLTTLTNSQTFTLRAFTPVGCETYDSVLITVFRVAEILMPNAFSPNGDGLNDRLRPVWRGIAQVRYFRIFNRFGQLIFETSDPQIGWDGRFKGKDQLPGNYVWEAAGYGFRGNLVRQQGNVVLVR